MKAENENENFYIPPSFLLPFSSIIYIHRMLKKDQTTAWEIALHALIAGAVILFIAFNKPLRTYPRKVHTLLIQTLDFIM